MLETALNVNHLTAMLSVSNLKYGEHPYLRIPVYLNIFNLKPAGLADLTASTVLDAVSHRKL